MEGWKGGRVDFQKRAQAEMLMTYVDRLISKGGRYFSISRGGRVDFLHIRMGGLR